jgi:hypothetical protein
MTHKKIQTDVNHDGNHHGHISKAAAKTFASGKRLWKMDVNDMIAQPTSPVDPDLYAKTEFEKQVFGPIFSAKYSQLEQSLGIAPKMLAQRPHGWKRKVLKRKIEIAEAVSFSMWREIDISLLEGYMRLHFEALFQKAWNKTKLLQDEHYIFNSLARNGYEDEHKQAMFYEFIDLGTHEGFTRFLLKQKWIVLVPPEGRTFISPGYPLVIGSHFLWMPITSVCGILAVSPEWNIPEMSERTFDDGAVNAVNEAASLMSTHFLFSTDESELERVVQYRQTEPPFWKRVMATVLSDTKQ